VQIDTGSSDLWVPVQSCTSCNFTLIEPALDSTEQAFKTDASSTFVGTQTEADVPYGDGTGILGTVATDTVTIGQWTFRPQSHVTMQANSFPTSPGQFSVAQQTFITAEKEQGEFDIAGLIGMGWPSLASSHGTPWWLGALSQFEAPEFSFYLSEWDDTSSSTLISPGGQLTLGGRNTSVIDGDVSFSPLISQSYWLVNLDSIVVSSNTTLTLTGANGYAAIDSGSTIITGPTSVVDAFYAAVDGAVRGETISRQLSGEWLVPCSTSVNAQFNFGNATVTLPAASLHEPTEAASLTNGGVTYCLGAFTGADTPSEGFSLTSPAWVIGDSLFKGNYIVFRNGAQGENPSVGFGKLKGVNYNTNGNAVLGVDGDGIDPDIGNAGGAPTASTGGSGHSGVGRGMVMRSSGAVLGFGLLINLLMSL
jgi:cathepsin D